MLSRMRSEARAFHCSARLQPKFSDGTMDFVRQDLRIAVRSLLKRPGFTAAAVLTLALGIGATTTVFSVVNGVLLEPLPFREPNRLAALWQTNTKDPGAPNETSSSPMTRQDWMHARTLESVAMYSTANTVMQEGGEPQVLPAADGAQDEFRRVCGARAV